MTRRNSGRPGSVQRDRDVGAGCGLPTEFKRFTRVKGRLGIINGEVLDLPNGAIAQLEPYPQIFRIHDNRPIKGHNDRTSLTIGSRAAQRSLG